MCEGGAFAQQHLSSCHYHRHPILNSAASFQTSTVVQESLFCLKTHVHSSNAESNESIPKKRSGSQSSP